MSSLCISAVLTINIITEAIISGNMLIQRETEITNDHQICYLFTMFHFHPFLVRRGFLRFEINKDKDPIFKTYIYF